MNEYNTKYFSTGEFAKLCNVHKKTLFHYDDIDLFKPEKVMDNGYRYYSEFQLEAFNVIYTLKGLGMPLKEIKEFIDKRNPKSTIELFEHESNEIDKELQELNIQLVQLTTGKEELQNKLFKLKQLQKQVKSIQINGEYTWEEICNLIQTIKVYKDKLIVTIDINGIVFTEELIY